MYWCLVLWTVRTAQPFSSQLSNIKYTIVAHHIVCVYERVFVEITYTLIMVEVAYTTENCIMFIHMCEQDWGIEREWRNKEKEQLERQECVAPVSDCSIFNDALVSPWYTTLLLPRFLSALSTVKHTNPASCNSIFQLPLPIVYFMDPLWSIQICCFCQPLTVLCVCHSGLVKG